MPNLQVEGGGHQTALHLAVRYLALPAVHILASQGAELNAVDSSGMTALHMASGILHRDITASLIRLGANVDTVSICLLYLSYTLFFHCCTFLMALPPLFPSVASRNALPFWINQESVKQWG